MRFVRPYPAERMSAFRVVAAVGKAGERRPLAHDAQAAGATGPAELP